MKIQILNANNINECIDGYTPIILDNGQLNIDVPDNSVSEILCYNSLEDVPYDFIDSTLSNIVKLLRLNGKLRIIGLEINCLCRDLINQTINATTYNTIIYSRKAIYDVKELSSQLKSKGLTIDTLLLRGSLYELHASRSN